MDLIPYIVVTLFLAICVILSWLFIDQKHHALQKVRSLRIEEKRQILSDLAGHLHIKSRRMAAPLRLLHIF